MTPSRFPKKPEGLITQGAVKYARDVVDEKVPASDQVIWECDRYLRRGQDKDWRYDEDTVERIGRFISKLPHPSGEWCSDYIELAHWQKLLISSVYGWMSRDDPDTRAIRECFLAVPRKAGKSTFAGALGLVDLCIMRRNEPRILCTASIEEQAEHVYKAAVGIVRRSPGLQKSFKLTASGTQIASGLDCGGSMAAISGNLKTMDGHRPTLVVIDEVHAMSNPEYVHIHRTSMASTQNPLILMPTTAGDTPCSVGLSERERYLKFAETKDGGDGFFGLCYEVSAEDDPSDPKVWAKAQPSMGLTVKPAFYRHEYESSLGDEEKMGKFLTRQLNVWGHDGMHTLFPIEAWQDLPKTELDWRDMPRLERAWIGLDMSEVSDLTSVTLLGEVDGKLHAWWEIFVPGKAAALAEEAARTRGGGGQVHYPEWIRDGFLHKCRGRTIDYAAVAEVLLEMTRKHSVNVIGSDFFVALYKLADALPATTKGKIIRIQKTPRRYTTPTRELQRLVAERELTVKPNPCVDWCFACCVAERRVDGSILPKKVTTHSPDRIDAVDSLIVAIEAREAEKHPKDGPMPLWESGALEQRVIII